ncbi:MAG: hypothetical protein LBQ03_02945 [Puniceicoccales bacterium]|nr:hypothetical protein [Puniceicoccales bacterium]
MTKVQVNYRSTPEILDFANGIPVSERIEHTKILKSTKNPFRKPIVVSVLDARQQANFVVKRLAGLHSEVIPYRKSQFYTELTTNGWGCKWS